MPLAKISNKRKEQTNRRTDKQKDKILKRQKERKKQVQQDVKTQKLFENQTFLGQSKYFTFVLKFIKNKFKKIL